MIEILQWVTPILVTLAIGAGKFYSDKQKLETKSMITTSSEMTRELIEEVKTDLTDKIGDMQTSITNNVRDDKWRDDWLKRHDEEIKEIRKKVWNGSK